MSMYQLRNLGSNLPRRICLPEEGQIVIGRSEPSDIVLPEVLSLSRQHVRITVSKGSISIVDLNSKNGTFVNGVSLTEGAIVQGDKVEFGSMTFALEDCGDMDLENSDENTRFFKPDILFQEVGANNQFWRNEQAIHVLYKVSGELLRQSRSENYLQFAVDLTREALQADFVYLHLISDGGEICDEPAAKSRCADIVEANNSIQGSFTLLNRVVSEKVAVMAANVLNDPHLQTAKSIIFSGIRSVISAPLMVEDRVLGVITADIRMDMRTFESPHLELLSAIANLLALGLEQSRLYCKIDNENRIRQRLEQFHSPAVVEEVIRQGGGVETRELEAAVWFCDLHGFTAMAEICAPCQVERRINEFFELGVASVFEFGGTLDRYLGDGFLAVFGAPFEHPDDSLRAVNAAIALHQKIAKRNLSVDPAERLEIRSGINTGKVIAGDIGARVRRDYTIIGDTVNVSQRLQHEVATVGDIVIGYSTAIRVRKLIPLEDLGKVILTGREQKTRVFRVKW